jgi:hypothetical protein
MPLEPQNLDEAAKLYSDTNDKLGDAISTFYEKTAFYSAGIISLSLTFIGYILSKPNNILFYKVCGLPLYYVIFAAWLSLFLSLILSLYIRLFSSQHSSLLAHNMWVGLYAKDRQNILEQVKAGQATVTGIEEDKLPEWLETAGNTVKEYGTIVAHSDKKLKIYDFVSHYIRIVASALFIIGALLTLVFAAIAILNL